MTIFSSTFHARRRALALFGAGAIVLSAVLSGCGGSGTSVSTLAGVRTVDTVPNGSVASIKLNGNAVSGTQTYFSASQYQSIGSGPSTVSFTLSADTGAVFPTASQVFSSGNFYSVVLAGRADVTNTADPRYPALIVASDTLASLSTSQASVRIIHVAPDLGSIDVLINGTVVSSSAAYKSVSGYLGVPSGNITLQINQAGGSSVVIPSQSLNLTAGHAYTVFLVEPTVAPTPAYAVQQTDDTSTSVASASVRVK